MSKQAGTSTQAPTSDVQEPRLCGALRRFIRPAPRRPALAQVGMRALARVL